MSRRFLLAFFYFNLIERQKRENKHLNLSVELSAEAIYRVYQKFVESLARYDPEDADYVVLSHRISATLRSLVTSHSVLCDYSKYETVRSAVKTLEGVREYMEEHQKVAPEQQEELIKILSEYIEQEAKDKKEGFSPRQYVTLTVDGLIGHAVLYAEDSLEVEKDPRTPGPSCDFAISSSDAAKLALDQYKGILLEHGLRTRSRPRAQEISEGKKKRILFVAGSGRPSPITFCRVDSAAPSKRWGCRMSSFVTGLVRNFCAK